MKYTENYGFDKPEGTDFVDVEHFNANTEQLDKLLCPEYTEEKTIAELQSGEKLSTAFGKLAKAVKDLISHLADKVVHITSNERTLWNTVSNKADSNHTHNYAGSSSAGGAANSAKTLQYTRYIDGIPFDGSSNLSRLGTCTTATYTSDKEVAISAFDDEGAQDAILYIQFTATYEGALNDAHAISINGGEPLTIYYKGEVFKWETYFSNYPFCDGQIHQFRYFWTPMGSYLELIAPQNRAVANNLTTTNEKIALAAPMGKQLAETDASLQEQISTLNSNMPIFIKDKHTVSLDTTCDEALYTLYTAEKPCFVSFTSLVYWIHVRPTSITLAINTNDNLYSSKVFKTTENLNNHVHLSGCAYLNRGERISVYATAESAGIDDIYTTLMINYV